MKRSLIALVGLATAAAWIEDPFEKQANLTCGNCYVMVDGRTRCNTGGSNDRLPYDANQNFAGTNATEVNFHGVARAQAVTVEELMTSTTIGLGMEGFNKLFCADYLRMYRDGAISRPEDWNPADHKGAACVRDTTAEAVMQADEEARTLYNKFATVNGYPSGYAVNRNKPFTTETLKYGTDFTGDLPMNWCGVHMKSIMCGVAFPQVIANKTLVDAKRAEMNTLYGRAQWNAKGMIRAISYEDCESVFQTCNRREPIEDDETSGSYRDPAFFTNGNVHSKALMIEKTFDADFKEEDFEHAVENNHFCAMWARGYAQASAGTPLLDDTDDEVSIQYDAAGAQTASLLLVAAAAVAALVQ